MHYLKRTEAIAGIMIVIAFFLPWLSYGSEVASAFSLTATHGYLWLSPLSAAILVYAALKNMKVKEASIIAAIISVGVVLNVYNKFFQFMGDNFTETFSVGVYITLLASAFLLFKGVTTKKVDASEED